VGELRRLAIAPPGQPQATPPKSDPAAPGAPPQGDLSPARYHARVEKLQAKERSEGLTVTERVSLSAYLIRLQKTEEAQRVLAAAEAEEPDNYQVLANLATAYLLLGLSQADPNLVQRAIDYQEKALAAWPELVAGESRSQHQWHRRVEQYQLALLRSRQQELARGGARAQPTLDQVFADVSFAGPKGEYTPGEIAVGYRAQLPPDAVFIVMQMVVWMPLDNQVYWLLGEVFNSQGDIADAWAVFNELVTARNMTGVPELLKHYAALRTAEAVRKKTLEPEFRAWQQKLLWAAGPRPAGLTPGTALGNEIGWLAAIHQAQQSREREGDPTAMQSFPQPPAPAPPPAKPDTAPTSTILTTLWYGGIGFAFGVLFALILGQQFRPRGSNKVPAAPTPG
jgi:tetratricopeptide (TPR) repeat protein